MIWDEWAQRVYLTTLVRDVRYALVALTEVRSRASQKPPDPLLWIPLETFLMFTAKVSKMLRPVGLDNPPKSGDKKVAYDRRKFRGERLRALLVVEETSPVLNRSVRDASEHFDERLDAWIDTQPRATADEVEAEVFPTYTRPPLRILDESDVVEVAGERLELNAIEDELLRLLAASIKLDPLAGVEDPLLATGLAALPPLPAELRLTAPSRRPDEDVRTGVDLEVADAWWDDFQERFAALVERLRKNQAEGQGE